MGKVFVRSLTSNHEETKQYSSRKIVSPGEIVTSDSGFMRGHGTFLENGNLLASVAGLVEKVNKLICVKPVKSRYTGEIGDVVVGRVTEVGQKRWTVDTNSRQDSVLLLSAINLPGGVLRRKLECDELQMRFFFVEGDVLSAEVQNIYADGALAIHTRNFKYGKLRNGMIVNVPPGLIKRSKSHFYSLPCGVDVVLGMNGSVWVQKHQEPITVEESELLYSAENDSITLEERDRIVRVANCIQALSKRNFYIFDSAIIFAYESSLSFKTKDLLIDSIIDQIASESSTKLQMLIDTD